MSGNNDHRFNRRLGSDTIADVRKHLSLPRCLSKLILEFCTLGIMLVLT